MQAKKIFLVIITAFLVVCCTSNKDTANTNKKTSTNVFSASEIPVNDMMIDAVTALETNDMDKAERLYNEVLKKDKTNSTAMFYLANIYFQKQDIVKAVDYAKQSIKLNDSNIWYKMQLAQIYIAQQEYEEAAKVFEDIVKQQPETLEYWQQLLSLYHVLSKDKKEVEILDKMEERFGISEMFSMTKYSIYNENGDDKNAEHEILALTKSFPNKSKYWSILAEREMKKKDYDKAFYYYNKVKGINPNEEYLNLTFANYYLAKGNEDSLYFYLQKAAAQEDILFKTKMDIIFTVYKDKVDTDTNTFYKFFNLMKIMRQTHDTNECQLWSMLNIGYMRAMDMKQGAYSAKKAIELGCNNYDLYQNWLYAASTFESADTIIEIANKTVEVYPEQPLPYLFVGVNHLQKAQQDNIKGEYHSAIDALNKGLKRCGNNKNMQEDFYINLGDAYYGMDDDLTAFDYYEKVLAINPDNYGVLNNYAYYLALKNKNLDKAEQYAKKVYDKYPDNATFVDTYAWVLFVKGEYSQAKNIMDTILKDKASWSKDIQKHYKLIIEKIK